MSTKILLSNNVKKFRLKLGLSQKKLASNAGLVITAITKIEQGISTQPTIQTVVKIADALNISLDELTGRKLSTKHKW